MITDALLRLSGTSANPNVPQTLATITVGTAVMSTYYVDLNGPTNVSGGTTSAQNRDIGEGEDLYAVLTVETQFTQATAGTFVVDIIVSDDTAGTSNATVIGNITVPWITSNTNLAPGQVYVARINPQIGTVGQRYLSARYNATGNNITAGKVYLDIVTDIYDSKKFYGGGFKVS